MPYAETNDRVYLHGQLNFITMPDKIPFWRRFEIISQKYNFILSTKSTLIFE